jgi:hypothetical protein
MLICLVAAKEAATLLASAAAGMAGSATVDCGRVVVDVFIIFTDYLALAVGWLDGEDGVGRAVGSFEGVDYADPVTDGLSVGALARVSIAPACAVDVLFRTDNSLDRWHSAAVAYDGGLAGCLCRCGG